MKKLIFAAICLIGILSSASVQAQGFNDIFSTLKTHEGITGMEIAQPGAMLPMMMGKQPGAEEMAIINKAENVQVLIAQPAASEKMNTELNKYIKSSKLQELVNVSEMQGIQNFRAYAIKNSKSVRNLLVFVQSQNQHIAVNIVGEFPLEDIQSLLVKNKISVNVK